MDKKQSIEQFKGQTRLPKLAIPKRYDLSACTFSGTVLIDLSIVQVTEFLVLNALELAVHEVWFANSCNQSTHKPPSTTAELCCFSRHPTRRCSSPVKPDQTTSSAVSIARNHASPPNQSTPSLSPTTTRVRPNQSTPLPSHLRPDQELHC
ncbi:Peptidase M1, alanine aminopeptidase/leukotriene A4 hydrolase [Trema orientale]|uniref:Peptidase M1, alanine aminopeptidase/leukotriene A4 hydrolase n=1 Tax=Trema orientale TaxID=63057 RepID=A0A2P5FW57_TREOI|nr:Peptidase M1, alanine aminopeptidase/leukotriene A4 hydrolase [Trema orientale]